jgi:NADPH:quinone reductase
MAATLPPTPPPMMRAAVINGFGGIERMEIRSLPLPSVGPGDVLIRVEAAGVGSWDATEREGGYEGAFDFESTFPYVLGWDGAGTIAAIGDHVTRFAVGERVYAASMPLPRGGFYAEYAVVDEAHAARVPERLTIEQSAALPWDGLTAQSGLDVLDLEPGTTLMIFGASGGIGHMALQFARRRGASVLAVASGDDGVALAGRLGADAVVDGRRDDVVAAARAFSPGGIDAALVTVGGVVAERALTAVREGARVAVPHGVMPVPAVPPGAQLLLFNGDRSAAATTRLNTSIDAGPFEVHVAHTFPLDRAADAHRALAAHYVGKLALRVAR